MNLDLLGPESMFDALALQLAPGLGDLAPQTPDELHEWISRELGFDIPRIAVCPDHQSAFQFLEDAYFGRVLDLILIGPRAGGKTLGLAILDVVFMEHLGLTIANVGAIEEQAKKCYAYIDTFVRLPNLAHKLVKAPMLSKTFLKNGGSVEVLPGTMNRVNSPHTNRLHWDEIELADPLVLEESKAIPTRQITPEYPGGRPPATIWTSSRKFAYGPMEDMLDNAGERGIPVYKYCVLDVAEQCPPERHLEGAGCADARSAGYQTINEEDVRCPLFESCKYQGISVIGETTYQEGPGRLANAHGWYVIDDLIAKWRGMTKEMFDSQMLSKRPMTKGMAFPMFDNDRHVIDYEYDPAFPVVCGIDFGYVHPSVALYAQPTPRDEVVIFAEDFKAQRTPDELAASMKTEPWFHKTRWRVGDSAQRSDRETLIKFGVPNEAAQKEGTAEEPSSRKSTVDLIRYLLEPQGRSRPLLYFSRNVPNLIRQVKRYHYPADKPEAYAKEEAAKVDDDAVDAMRYMMRRLYRDSIAV